MRKNIALDVLLVALLMLFGCGEKETVCPVGEKPASLLVRSLHGTSRGMEYFYSATGDGNTYDSLLESGAIDADCFDCHNSEDLPASPHQLHTDKVDCSACHVKSTISCYNCHFEQGAPAGAFDWKILVKGDGKIHAGNMMTAVSTSGPKQTFAVVAPFYGHTVYRPDPATLCSSCHDNELAGQYRNTGTMRVTWWDNGLQHYTGADPIMVPEDWASSMVVTFVHDSSGTWVKYKDSKDVTQMLYGSPLTAQEINDILDAF